MPIKIHHGPNGSYKTSGAVWDDAVPAMKAGRPLITNIRGMTTERCLALFPDLPDSFEVIWIDTETVEGLDRARRWFHWAPRNAFIIFDEPQTIFLKKWTEKALEQFDYPGGPDKAKEDDRPIDFLDAWTRQRHWNWDIVLCTPNIRYLRDDIRQTCEMAYLHTNFAVLGTLLKRLLNADYKEVMHSAQDNRPGSDDKTIIKFRKIDKRVFKLYDSTATGQHRDTFTGQNLLASPKVLMPVGFLVILFAVMYYRTGFSLATDGLHAQSTAQASAPSAEVSAVRAEAPGPVVPDDVHPAVSPGAGPKAGPLAGPYSGVQLSIKACLYAPDKGVKCLYQATPKGGKPFTLSTGDLVAAQYEVFAYGLCAAKITYKGTSADVVCSGEGRTGNDDRAAERGGAGRAGAGATASTRVTIVEDSSRMPRTL